MRQALITTAEASLGLLPFKKQIFSALRSLRPPKKVWSRLRFKGKFKVAVDQYSFFYLNHYGYGFENGIFWRGLYKGWGEEQPLRLWQKLCSRAEVIFDVGANMGVYSLVAKAINPKARVYGFEPVAHLHHKFAQNCDLNRYDIKCVRAGVSNEDGTAELHIMPGGLATASFNPNQLRTVSERVATMRLDSFITTEGLKKVDLMKIDVEGYEPQVLTGMGEYLVSMKPSIIVEILSDEAGQNIEALVQNCSYSYFCIDEERGPLRQSHLRVKDRGRHSRNFLLCSETVANELNLP